MEIPSGKQRFVQAIILVELIETAQLDAERLG